MIGKLFWKLKYVIILIAIPFFYESYFVFHRKLYQAILIAGVAGIVTALLVYFICKFLSC